MANDETRLTVDLFSWERLGNTANGNPRYKFATSEGTFTLQSDAGYGYEVTNHRFPRPAVLVLSKARRVRWIEETHKPIPDDFPVRPLAPGEQPHGRTTDGQCGLSWDDSISTQYTPTPSGRCPFEAFHVYKD